MDINTITILASVLVAIAVSFFALWRSGQPLSVQAVTESFADAQSLAIELREVAEMAVAASQQLKESGKITSNQEAFDRAVKHVDGWLETFWPNEKNDLDPQVVRNAVESAYFYLKQMKSALPATSQPPSTEVELAERFLREGGTDIPL